MEHSELSKKEMQDLKTAILNEVTIKPPTIGLIGVSGVGKSSTINALFKTNLATSDTVACTKEFDVVDLSLKFNEGTVKGHTTNLRVIDAPGLGEDIDLDPYYLQMYKENLQECDVILWLQTARNRAISIDQNYLKQLECFHQKIIFGLNQVDLVEPMNWNLRINLPSQEQVDNIQEIVNDRRNKMSKIINNEIKIVPFSSKTRYNLQQLFTEILLHCPDDRIWIFESLKNFKYDDFLPPDIRKIVDKEMNKKQKKGFLNKLKNIFNKLIKLWQN